ncbi:MAG TPA: hypothetical protein VE152_01075 [Acidimicrobiales bacterium]|nr:hypothetical protein [Acidimicrobiales bacterium]
MDEVQYRKEDVANVLRRAGRGELAEEAMRDLPDPVDLGYVVAWGARHGVTREGLISEMGGNP